ncbi:hypothetical protein [Brevibacillus laterosporus]|uniref:hypothetical protein n=1 Tax=Brevibacillus laterosporus TaxID=1465 RepID=UPI00264CB323|nr:hypothetical protein [Brevibacillus laterosporus]MDN9011983.1 hypothetical protein [Brevibacillus laterosporus]MDO0943079.1 hypothetical protein [Brevibacillus laterosporus]
MKQFLSGYSGSHRSMYVLPIEDIHFGNRYHNPKYLDKALQFVVKNRNRTRILLMGDLMEVATKAK